MAARASERAGQRVEGHLDKGQLLALALALALALTLGPRTAAAVPAVAQGDAVVDVHGLDGVRASLLKTDSVSSAVLGVDSFLCFVPTDAATEARVLARNFSLEQPVKLGVWEEATPLVPDGSGAALTGLLAAADGSGSGQLRLVRRDAAAGGVWHTQECINDQASFLRQRMFVTNGMFDRTFAPRGQGAAEKNTRCHRGCGFGVFDDTIPSATMSDVMAVVRANAAAMKQKPPSTVSRKEAYAPSGPEQTLVALLSEPVIALLAEKAGIVPAELELTNARVDLGLRASGHCEMHSDFHSSKTYVYTAIVYLSDWGDMFTGGETVFAHQIGGIDAAAAEGAAVAASDPGREAAAAAAVVPVTGGYIVQPKIGRVTMFTGGTENLHCKMPSTKVDPPAAAAAAANSVASDVEQEQGEVHEGHASPRLVVQLWVQCASAGGESLGVKGQPAASSVQSRALGAEQARNSALVKTSRAWVADADKAMVVPSREERAESSAGAPSPVLAAKQVRAGATDRALP